MKIGRLRTLAGNVVVACQIDDDCFDVTLDGGPTTIAMALAELHGGVLASRCIGDALIDVRRCSVLAPIDPDVRVLCTGFNFRSHASEVARNEPTNPTFFQRFASSLVGPNEPIILPTASVQLDWEGEIAFVIGRGGRAITAEAALDHVAGYTLFGDHSVRDFQLHGTQATAGKNFDASGAIGPWIVTPDEAPPLEEMELVTRLNGAQVQHGRFTDLVFGVADLIAYISTFMTLRPGDVVATGTPAGIGGRRDPPRWLKAGEQISVEAPGLGVLSNVVTPEENAR